MEREGHLMLANLVVERMGRRGGAGHLMLGGQERIAAKASEPAGLKAWGGRRSISQQYQMLSNNQREAE